MEDSDYGMASSTDDNSMLTLHLDPTENTLTACMNTTSFEWLHKFFTREAKTPTSHGRLLDNIDGKIIRQKVNRKSFQASPKAFRQESLCSLTGCLEY